MSTAAGALMNWIAAVSPESSPEILASIAGEHLELQREHLQCSVSTAAEESSS
jgi:hypothetical protein